ncbi:MAG: hypothetical protein EOP83_06695 [Verrucomicrobiaceae bacterium]|nr:MAG: hypothetical protein EOP83_06695 [Verrucomicrobiaceae bacterium]
MKNRLCYAWFGDEDVKQIFSSLNDKLPTDGAGEIARKASSGNASLHREIRREPPRTQPLFKRP